MTDKANGGVAAGEFLTGNMDFFTIATLVPVTNSYGYATNVDTPVADLYTQQGYTTWQTVTVVDGSGASRSYASQSAYQDAYNIQSNLNLLLQLFAQRANPVAISVGVQTVGNPHTSSLFAGFSNNSGVFGSAYTSSQSVYTVKLATEKTGLWNVSATADSNDNGYQLLTALQGVAVADVAANVLTTHVFEVNNATNCNTLAVRALTL